MLVDVVLPVAGLAVLDTLSPAVLGVSLYVVLSGRQRIAAPLLVFLGTVAAFYFTVGVALMLGLQAVLGAVGDIGNSPAVTVVRAVAGAGLLVYSFLPERLVRRRQRRTLGEPRELRAPVMIGLGLGAGLLEVGLVLPYLAAIGIITAAELPAIAWLPLIAGYNLIMITPPLLIYLGHRIARGAAEPRLRRWRERIRGASHETVAWLTGILGFVLLAGAVQEFL